VLLFLLQAGQDHIFTSLVASLPSSAPPVNINSDTSASAAPSNHTAAVVASVIGVLFCVAVCVGALYYMKWRRLRKNMQHETSYYPKSTEPSIASFVAGYSAPESHAGHGDYTYYMPAAPSLTTGATRSASPSLSVSTSFVSIPKSIYEPSIAESYSPAAPSSALYTTNLEHSPLAESVERAIPEDQRIAMQKRWHLTPVRRVEE
jgi:hypothetical protein